MEGVVAGVAEVGLGRQEGEVGVEGGFILQVALDL